MSTPDSSKKSKPYLGTYVEPRGISKDQPDHPWIDPEQRREWLASPDHAMQADHHGRQKARHWSQVVQGTRRFAWPSLSSPLAKPVRIYYQRMGPQDPYCLPRLPRNLSIVRASNRESVARREWSDPWSVKFGDSEQASKLRRYQSRQRACPESHQIQGCPSLQLRPSRYYSEFHALAKRKFFQKSESKN